jgi:UDP-GlcNAc:undecaprenyl-phosphate GlcNAc-1-phosphate transferase
VTHGVRYALAFAVPLVAALGMTPVMARVARRHGVVNRPGPDRASPTATPLLGGVGIGLVLIAVAWVTSGFEGRLVTMLLAAAAVGTVGLIDDLRGLAPSVRVCVEALAAVALWIAGIRVGFFGIEALDLLLTIAWVVAITNALNLLDNTDGVASGVTVVAALGFAMIAAQAGHYLVGSLAFGVAGASLGFLRWNFPPAKIYLGDAGALLLGFLLAALGLELDLVGPSAIERAVIPALVLAVPLFDLVLVIVARRIGGRPITVGGTDHAAHRLLASGRPVREVVLSAIAAQTVCSALAIHLSRAGDATVVLASIAVATVALAAWVVFLRLDPSRPGATQPVELAGTDAGPRAAPISTRAGGVHRP